MIFGNIKSSCSIKFLLLWTHVESLPIAGNARPEYLSVDYEFISTSIENIWKMSRKLQNKLKNIWRLQGETLFRYFKDEF